MTKAPSVRQSLPNVHVHYTIVPPKKKRQTTLIPAIHPNPSSEKPPRGIHWCAVQISPRKTSSVLVSGGCREQMIKTQFIQLPSPVAQNLRSHHAFADDKIVFHTMTDTSSLMICFYAISSIRNVYLLFLYFLHISINLLRSNRFRSFGQKGETTRWRANNPTFEC